MQIWGWVRYWISLKNLVPESKEVLRKLIVLYQEEGKATLKGLTLAHLGQFEH